MSTKLQTSPNRWTCLPTAFGMAMDVKVGFIVKWLGHDGSDVVRPGLSEPDCYRGFHIQELIGYAWWKGFAVTPFEANPRITVDDGSKPILIEFGASNAERMLHVLHENIGVLTGQARPSGLHHAVCWNGFTNKIYNPIGVVQGIEDFAINTFWCLSNRQQ